MDNTQIIPRPLKSAPKAKTAWCALASCNKRFVRRRPHQKYHTTPCRLEAFRLRRADEMRRQIVAEIMEHISKEKAV